ncbi:hypothetical protein [Phaeobacter sp. C3_T13_0]|uniref:hypothetical protein n=1 Tax=Phaeobacter cretensis TaxID=3342641 RepID=UPI0039BD58AF
MQLQIRNKSIDDYQGFFIPKSISLGRYGQEYPTYHLIIVGGEVDARIEAPSSTKSPWVLEDQPSLASIEGYWQLVRGADEIKEMLRLFEIVENHARNNQFDDVTNDEKLSSVRREDVNVDALYTFSKMLGADD